MHVARYVFILLALSLALVPRHSRAVTNPSPAQPDVALYSDSSNVQAFLDAQPGVLKTYTDEGQSAATIIEGNSIYYGINANLHLVLLETVSSLLSDPAPPASTLRQPYGSAGPDGFAAQIEWASRELRAGLGPYNPPLILRFTDQTAIELSLDQSPEAIAVQRFLAIGRTQDEWKALNQRFEQVAQSYFPGEVIDVLRDPSLDTPPDRTLPDPDEWQETPDSGFLHLPWPAGTNVFHLAYFDHVYPTVDSSADGNTMVVTYLGEMVVQYNTHDGHDYTFPDQLVGTPILAAAPGVAYARSAPGNGVVILHGNGYETVYWHLDTFAPTLRGLVDSSQGVWVDTGDMLGTSGSSGFTHGTPHLHFEVRHHGRQIDPYGWYGIGPDPCAAYAGCAPSRWLWHESLRGTYDFTPPNEGSTPTQAERDAPPDFMQPGASANRGGGTGNENGAPPPPPPPDNEPPPPPPPPGPPAEDDDPLSLDGPQMTLQEPPDPNAPSPTDDSDNPPAPTAPPVMLGTADEPSAPPAQPGESPALPPDFADNLPPPVPPDVPVSADDTPPIGTLSINPPPDLLLYVPFDGHMLQQVGSGVPGLSGAADFEAGQYGQAVRLPFDSDLTYPITSNLRLQAGTISLWARVPERFPPNTIDRHYLFAASANPEDLANGVYTNTLALRRDLLGPNETPRWNFWTTPRTGDAGRDDLAIADTLEPGWHHFAVTWDTERGSKALYLNGKPATFIQGVTLPDEAGSVLHIGRFIAGGSPGGMAVDELAIFGRALESREIRGLANTRVQSMPFTATNVQTSTLVLDTNASDAESGIAQMQLGRDGAYLEPEPFHEGYAWQLPPTEGDHTLEARYVDGAGNQAHITQTVTLELAPRGTAQFAELSNLRATLQISATDQQPPIEMQISATPDFHDVDWEPLNESIAWRWPTRLTDAELALIPELYVRFRDADGMVSEPQRVSTPTRQVYLPFVMRSATNTSQRAATTADAPEDTIFLPFVQR
jgi:murein DD-endopeptidase MepM/ murein hydrolase activator NlpD